MRHLHNCHHIAEVVTSTIKVRDVSAASNKYCLTDQWAVYILPYRSMCCVYTALQINALCIYCLTDQCAVYILPYRSMRCVYTALQINALCIYCLTDQWAVYILPYRSMRCAYTAFQINALCNIPFIIYPHIKSNIII